MKYILVTGLRRGIGQGVTTGSIGALMKACDLNVTAIKIDSEYDASLLHGKEEVFVLEDGSEVHSHLGCFERFSDVTLHKLNYMKIKSISVEDNQSQCIKEVQDRIANAAKTPVTKDQRIPEVCIIELSATIWDIHFNYVLEALHQLRSKEDACCIHICKLQANNFTEQQVLELTNQEMKLLGQIGFKPDLVMCHSENNIITDSVKDEFSNFCQVSREHVIWIHNPLIYELPLILESQNVIGFLADRLQLNIPHQGPRPLLQRWKDLVDKCKKCERPVDIALLCMNVNDAGKTYRSIITALRDAALYIHAVNIKYINASGLQVSKREEGIPFRYYETWMLLKSCSALIVPDIIQPDTRPEKTGTPKGVEGSVEAIRWARENNKPFLGIGQGMEFAVIEFAKYVLCYEPGVNNRHWFHVIRDPSDDPRKPFLRVGSKTTHFCTQESITRRLYGGIDKVIERHRRERDLSTHVIDKIEGESKGLRFVGKDVSERRMEIVELDGHPYFVALQFHPEYTSRPFKPAPPFLGLVLAATGKLKDFIDRKEGISDSEQLAKIFQSFSTC